MKTRTGQEIQEQDKRHKNRPMDTRTGKGTQEQTYRHKKRTIDARARQKIDTRSIQDKRNKNRIGHETQELLMNA